MLKRYYEWYKHKSPLQQVAMSFGVCWLCWFVLHWVGEWYAFSQPTSLFGRIFYATWMTVFYMLTFKSKQVGILFKKQKSADTKAAAVKRV